MTYDVELAGQRASISVRAHPEGGWWVAVDDGPESRVTGKQLGSAEWLLRHAGRSSAVGVHCDGDRLSAQVGGHGLSGTVVDPREHALDAGSAAAQGEVRTPMPGVVVRVQVEVGQGVTAGTVLLVVEAMKMENEFKSPIDGTVSAVHVSAGQALDANTALVTVVPQ